MTMRRKWTPEELAELDRRYPNERTPVLAAALGRSERAVFDLARRRGLKKSAEHMSAHGREVAAADAKT